MGYCHMPVKTCPKCGMELYQKSTYKCPNCGHSFGIFSEYTGLITMFILGLLYLLTYAAGYYNFI